MAINTVTDLRNTDAGQTGFTVRQNPVGGSTACHAVQITQAARSGTGSALNVVCDNSEAPAIQAKGAGSLLRLYDANRVLRFEIDNTGTVTTGVYNVSGAVSVTSVTTTGNVSVGGTLGVTGAATLASAGVTGNATVGGTLGVTGDTTLTGALGVSGYTTLAGGQANGDWAVFGSFSALGSNVGFFGTTATTKRTVSGAKGGNAALGSLLTALAAYGLITDSTSA